jgi:2-methylcitrate dehydratase PrpD
MHHTLFKFHASCYGTHAVLECAAGLRQRAGFDQSRIRSIEIDVGEECVRTCDIRDPRTEAQSKFSLRFNAAVGLLGLPTGDLSTYSPAVCERSDVMALQKRVSIRFVTGRPLTRADMRVTTDRGDVFEQAADTSLPLDDLDQQGARLLRKFDALTAGRLSDGDRDALASASQRVGDLDHLDPLFSVLRRARSLHPLNDQLGVPS